MFPKLFPIIVRVINVEGRYSGFHPQSLNASGVVDGIRPRDAISLPEVGLVFHLKISDNNYGISFTISLWWKNYFAAGYTCF